MNSTTALVDAHVHLHGCYRPELFFCAAAANLSAAGRQLRLGSPPPLYLVMTECASDRVFDELHAAARGTASSSFGLGRWTVSATDEEESLCVSSPDAQLYVIGGRQVACREGLEVLLLGTREQVPDGRSIHEVLEFAAQRALPRVIPWGAGKWFFSRGRLLTELVRVYGSPLFFLGDEGGRPWFWPYPRHFAQAAPFGVRDLPGTDPLPFPWDVDKVGRMGIALDLEFEARRPWHSLREALANPAADLRRFATLEGTVRFVQNQAGMQLRKRRAA